MQIFLNTPGTKVCWNNGTFCVENAHQTQHFDINDLECIFLGPGTLFTTDCLIHLADSNIDIFFVDKHGNPKLNPSTGKFGSISTIRKNQTIISNGPEAIHFASEWIIEKLNKQLALLIKFLPKEEVPILMALNEKCTLKIRDISDRTDLDGKFKKDQIRGWEGTFSRKYFYYWRTIVPPEFAFEERVQMGASDPVNICLNYAYGILYGLVNRNLIQSGLDPSIGFFHRDNYQTKAFLFDIIEQFRPWVDAPILFLFSEGMFINDFLEVSNSETSLNEEGKRLIILSVNRFLDEKITFKMENKSRREVIRLTINKFAQKLK